MWVEIIENWFATRRSGWRHRCGKTSNQVEYLKKRSIDSSFGPRLSSLCLLFVRFGVLEWAIFCFVSGRDVKPNRTVPYRGQPTFVISNPEVEVVRASVSTGSFLSTSAVPWLPSTLWKNKPSFCCEEGVR